MTDAPSSPIDISGLSLQEEEADGCIFTSAPPVIKVSDSDITLTSDSGTYTFTASSPTGATDAVSRMIGCARDLTARPGDAAAEAAYRAAVEEVHRIRKEAHASTPATAPASTTNRFESETMPNNPSHRALGAIMHTIGHQVDHLSQDPENVLLVLKYMQRVWEDVKDRANEILSTKREKRARMEEEGEGDM